MLDRKRQLNEVGFKFAAATYLRYYWPSVPMPDAVRLLMEYVGVPVGHPDYDWSLDAAHELARLYVEEFGEAA